MNEFTGGFVGVDVFFVISGYLIIPRPAADVAAGQFEWMSFMGRRLRRLVPAPLPVLIFAMAVSALTKVGSTRQADF